jgi:hypothetical protein
MKTRTERPQEIRRESEHLRQLQRRLEYLLDAGRYSQAVKEGLIGRQEAKTAKAAASQREARQ